MKQNAQGRVLALLVGVVLLGALDVHAQTAPPADAPPANDPALADAPPSSAGGPGTGNTSARTVGTAQGAAGGNGLALSPDGRSRLHIGLDVGAGFDTNPYSVPLGSPEGFAGDLVARIRPHVDVDAPGSTIAFSGIGMVDYGMIPGLVSGEQTRNFLLYQSLLGADLEVNRGGAFRFAVGDVFSWNSDPGFVVVGSLFNRITNNLRAGAGIRPGGGALDFRLGYDFQFVKYLDVEGFISTSDDELDNMTHTAQLRVDYKFLPKTGVFGVVSGGFNTYVNGSRDPAATPDSFPLNAQVGIQGQILAKLAGLASIGYANPFVVDEGQLVTGSLIGVVGQAEVQWHPSPTTRIGGGFQRSFAPAPLYQFLGNNRFYATLNQLLAGRFLLGVNAGYSILEFGEEQVELSTVRVGRLDGHLDGVVNLSYFFTDWLSLGISNSLDWRVTNADDPASRVNFGFIRNQTLLLASARY